MSARAIVRPEMAEFGSVDVCDTGRDLVSSMTDERRSWTLGPLTLPFGILIGVGGGRLVTAYAPYSFQIGIENGKRN